tara:strand:- start:1019 stop:1231 length:213 start_codon:yes stop_codon:yes gene_type:complete
MCVSVKAPAPPPMPEPAPVAPPPVTQNTQGSARPAGFSAEAGGRNRNNASSYDRKRTGSSNLRIPIIGGL